MDAVDLNTVQSSPEGIVHWSWLNLDKNKLLGSRCPVHQQFARAVKHVPGQQDMFANLDHPLQLEFKAAWCVKKDWDFTRETRVIETSHTEREGQQGELMNRSAIIDLLGGKADPEAVRQADSYIAMCEKQGGKFQVWNSWTDA
jgi:hypothetical protein